MDIQYDAEVDILYIRLADGARIEESSEPVPGLVLDHDASGRVVGLELMNASRTVSLPLSVNVRTAGDAESPTGRLVSEAQSTPPQVQADVIAERWPLAAVVGRTEPAETVAV